MKNYGKELVLDIHNCDITKFNKEMIGHFFIDLCDLIEMERVQTHWWEDHVSEEPHLRGVTAVQFIKTSNITIHTITLLKRVYLNIFSCSDFDGELVNSFSRSWFGGDVVNSHLITRC